MLLHLYTCFLDWQEATLVALGLRPWREGEKIADSQLNMQVEGLHQAAMTGKLCGTQVVGPTVWSPLAAIFNVLIT